MGRGGGSLPDGWAQRVPMGDAPAYLKNGVPMRLYFASALVSFAALAVTYGTMSVALAVLILLLGVCKGRTALDPDWWGIDVQLFLSWAAERHDALRTGTAWARGEWEE